MAITNIYELIIKDDYKYFETNHQIGNKFIPHIPKSDWEQYYNLVTPGNAHKNIDQWDGGHQTMPLAIQFPDFQAQFPFQKNQMPRFVCLFQFQSEENKDRKSVV